MRLIAAAALVLVACVARAGEVYKWTDKNGVVHYGDQPKHDARMIDLPGDEPDPDVRNAVAARDAECRRQREQLESYRSADRIAEKDSQGNMREYTPAERQKFLAAAEQNMATACAPASAAAPPAG